MPITLWSTLKIYFRMKPEGSAIGACTADPAGCACKLMRGLLKIGSRSSVPANASKLTGSLPRSLLLQKSVIVRVGHHVQIAVHAGMSQPAQLRAYNFILTDCVRFKMQRHHHSGRRILLQTQLSHEEIVNHVLRTDQQLH